MTVENDFLPIATGGGANVEDQATYAADGTVPSGFLTGAVPPATLFNKMVRQASVITSQFAQMICDYSGSNMLDNADLTTLLTTVKSQFRIRLLADTTFFVATTGNDTTGHGTSAAPWATLAHAYKAIQAGFDLGGFNCTIDFGAGTFVGAQPYGAMQGQASPIVINGAGATTVFSNGIAVSGGANVLVSNCNIGSTTDYPLNANAFSQITVGVGVSLTGAPAAPFGHIGAGGGLVTISQNMTYSGNSGGLLVCSPGGQIQASGISLTASGSISFGGATMICNTGNINLIGVSYPGTTPTGVRYVATLNGVINTAGGTLPPGTSGGTTSSGGQFA